MEEIVKNVNEKKITNFKNKTLYHYTQHTHEDIIKIQFTFTMQLK